MEAKDYRDMTFEEIKGHLVEDRLQVYNKLAFFGPVTTRQLALRMDRDILSVRPRVTELYKMGLARLVDVPATMREPGTSAREGHYEAIPLAEAEQIRRYGVQEQMQMQLGGV